MARLFGTDGIRGTANTSPMTATTALQVAIAAATVFKQNNNNGERRKVLIGKDTRLSCYMLESAMTAGFTAAGLDVFLVGPMPTPAVAMLTRSMRADVGVMISASHNPYQDNGIKLFGPDGFKLSDATEDAITGLVAGGALEASLAESQDIGRAKRIDDAAGRYIEFVKNTFPPNLRLDGLTVVVDCANGACYKVAPIVLRELGATVIPLSVTPDGTNINAACGATDTALLQDTVKARGADVGIALDGDGDRLILCDEQGIKIDGDQVMALIAKSYAASNRLKGGGVVATVMSNLGLETFVTSLGLDFRRTPVGDRYVVEDMRKSGCNVGGEQSGHIVLSDHATTGDGLMAALQVLAVLKQQAQPASQCLKLFDTVPQILRNVRFTDANPLETNTVQQVVADAEKRLNGQGRILIRKSGTEPVIRVMAEGHDQTLVQTVVDQICTAVEGAMAA